MVIVHKLQPSNSSMYEYEFPDGTNKYVNFPY